MKPFLTFCVFALTPSVLISPALAGFEWTPPVQSAPAQDLMNDDVPAAAPVIPVETLLPALPDDVISPPDPMALMQKETNPVPAPQPEPVMLRRKQITPTQAPSMQPMMKSMNSPETMQNSEIEESTTISTTVKEQHNEPVNLRRISRPLDIAPPPTNMERPFENVVQDAAAIPVINPFPQDMSSSATMPATSIPAQPAQPIQYEQVVGFGRDIPLAIALRQIVPPTFAFQFDPAINVGMPISWDGGAPWPETLQTILDPAGIMVDVRGNVVSLKPQQFGMAPTSSAM